MYTFIELPVFTRFAAVYFTDEELAGSRYFCERFLGVLPKNQQKLRDRYAFGCPSRPGHSFATQQGVAHMLSNDSTRCRIACIFTTQRDASLKHMPYRFWGLLDS